MPTIAVLPPAVAACIAAGEVIERPSSLLRELIENGLDAGARSLDVSIEEGGFAYLRVDDDGCGMEAADVPLAIQRHATAKLRTVEDLARLTTLGYRGEALAAAVVCADLELVTAVGGIGTYLRTENGRISVLRSATRSQGTTVCAYRAFSRLPGRRAALGTPEHEAAHCQHVVAGYALAHPEVRVRFIRDGRLVFRTTGKGDLRDVMAALYPPRAVARLVPVEESLGLAAGRVSVEGLIATPELARRTREHLRLAVNGRPVQYQALARAVESAYGPALAASRYPIAFLHLHLPPSEVDVNVHPGKATVRLRAEAAVVGLLRGAATRALREVMPAESAAPRTAAKALEPASVEALAKARWLGHWNDAYLVLADEEALYLVDQHAAAERVLYEEISRAAEPYRPARPVALHLEPAHAALVESLSPQLRALGFEADPLGTGSWALRAVPAAWRGLALAETFADMLADLAASSRLDPAAAAASAACHRALRRGVPLDEAQARALIDALARSGSPATCLHGRPAFLRLPLLAADRVFLRG